VILKYVFQIYDNISAFRKTNVLCLMQPKEKFHKKVKNVYRRADKTKGLFISISVSFIASKLLIYFFAYLLYLFIK